MLEELGMPEKAIASLEESLTVDPQNARALAAIGRLREQAGETDQALAVYRRSLEQNKYQPQVAARVASLQNSVGGPVGFGPSGDTRTFQQQPRVRRY